MATEQKENHIKICLLGPSFETGNLGVSALVESSIKAIIHQWPDAEVTLLGSGRVDCEHQLKLFGREVHVKSLPIRFCRNVFLPNHFVVLFFYAMLMKVFRWQRMREALVRRNPYLRTILEADMVADITGGDSFSDIYGMRRFIIGFLRKWLIKVFRKRLVLLPQTYGPFDKRLTKVLARHIANYVTFIYSRDRSGVNYVKKLIGGENADEKIKFVPDMGFILDPHRPSHGDIDSLEKIKTSNRTLVGLNISGLLYNVSDANDNLFNLKIDYLSSIDSIVEFLMKQEGTAILLVPHLVALREPDASPSKSMKKKGYMEQSDSVVCGRFFERVVEKYPDRIFLVRGHYNHNETKYIIGLCDFFIGSRMHSCIAALSQGIPAVGIAYSGKFHGVFESVGVRDCVADARSLDDKGVLEELESVFDRRDRIRKHLGDVIPQVKSDVLNIFDVPCLKGLRGGCLEG